MYSNIHRWRGSMYVLAFLRKFLGGSLQTEILSTIFLLIFRSRRS